jgi:hypothetical protein
VSLEAVSGHLATGDAWALWGEANTAAYRESRTIVYRPFLEPPLPGSLALLWPHYAASPLVPKLLEVAQRMAPVP